MKVERIEATWMEGHELVSITELRDLSLIHI